MNRQHLLYVEAFLKKTEKNKVRNWKGVGFVRVSKNNFLFSIRANTMVRFSFFSFYTFLQSLSFPLLTISAKLVI